jgi:high-affinity nickel-transport protein
MHVMTELFDLKNTPIDGLAALDLSYLGYAIIGVFLFAWGSSMAAWRLARSR